MLNQAIGRGYRGDIPLPDLQEGLREIIPPSHLTDATRYYLHYLHDINIAICTEGWLKETSEKQSNQKLDIIMDNEKLGKGNSLLQRINQLKLDIRDVEANRVQFPDIIKARLEEYINYEALKKQILASMRKKLAGLEKEFDKL